MLALLASSALLLAWAASAGAEGGGDAVDWSITIGPIEPNMGDTLHISATALAQGGIPKYTLHLDDVLPPVLRLDSPASVTAPTLPETVSWTLTALRPGRHALYVSVDFEKEICPGTPGPPPDCYYQFVFASSQTYTISVAAPVGDADCDGRVTSLDAAIVLQYNAGLLPRIPCAKATDPTGDGVWNAIDAALILQFVAGLIPHFV
jgi:hypothetical protein